MEPNVAMITVKDLAGERWNGVDLAAGLRRRGVPAAVFVERKVGDDPHVYEVARFPGRDRVASLITRIEERLSLQSVLYPWAEWIVRHPRFREANVVHLHIFHMEFMSLLSVPRLARGRRLVVTLHDLWPVTGHCVYPDGCERLVEGCGACPDLTLPFPLARDRAAEMLRRKRAAWDAAGAHFHVTTDWMLAYAGRAQASRAHGCTKIPLGIDAGVFRPVATAADRAALRARLGLPGDRFVVGLRATKNVWKGLPLAREALRSVADRLPLAVVTFQDRGALADLPAGVPVVDLGWIGQDAIADAYRCMDLFLMPSRAESFGYMALEAMASGVPVVALAGTATEEVVGPDAGWLLSERGADAVAAALLEAHADAEGLRRRGRAARERAATVFLRERYEDAMLQLYRRLLADDPGGAPR